MSDNPQAFPCPHAQNGFNPGMTLRDYFAGQALAGICSQPFCISDTLADRADMAYRHADHMLAQRNKK